MRLYGLLRRGTGRLPSIALSGALLLLASASPAEARVPTTYREQVPATDDPPPSALLTYAEGNAVTAGTATQVAGAASTPGGRAPQQAAVPLVEYLLAEECGVYSAGAGYGWPCSDGRTVDHSDICGARPAVKPLWSRRRASGSVPWGGWAWVHGATCVGDAALTADQVVTAFRRLPLAPSTLHVQPDRGWVLVNRVTIAYTDPAPQTLSTTLLGRTVTFTATPASYAWDYGDVRLVSVSPGHPYPHEDVAHAYRQTGTGRVRLTTTWSATYTVAGDPTVRDVPGTATTVTSSDSFQIVEARARLVRGDCLQYPDDWACH